MTPEHRGKTATLVLASPALLLSGMPSLRQKCACEGVQHAGGGARRGVQHMHADLRCRQHAGVRALTQAAACTQRYVYMRLDYHETAPADYEPPGFRPMDNAHAVHFDRKPFRLCDVLHARCSAAGCALPPHDLSCCRTVGAVHTAHHSVALRVKSVLEGENAEGETMQEASQEEQNSTLTCSTNDTEACVERPSRSMPTEVTAHVKPLLGHVMGIFLIPEPFTADARLCFPGA